MSDSRMSDDLAATLGTQQNIEQMEAAMKVAAAGAAVFRQALISCGFSQTEAMTLVSQWLAGLMDRAKKP